MTDLRRWSEEGATSGELDMLRAARDRRPGADTRARNLAKVGVGAGAALAATSGGSAAAGGLGGGAVAKIVAGAVFVVAAAGATWKLAGPAQDAGSSQGAPVAGSASAAVFAATAAAPAASSSPGAEASADPPPNEEPEAPLPSAAPAAPGRAPRARSSAAAASPSGKLAAEVLALERASRALDARSPAEALRELEKYKKQFPKGSLASEQIVLRVQALLAQGDHTRAAAEADRFAAAHPDSPYARRVQDMVRAARRKK
jgi:hypothetical protein